MGEFRKLKGSLYTDDKGNIGNLVPTGRGGWYIKKLDEIPDAVKRTGKFERKQKIQNTLTEELNYYKNLRKQGKVSSKQLDDVEKDVIEYYKKRLKGKDTITDIPEAYRHYEKDYEKELMASEYGFGSKKLPEEKDYLPGGKKWNNEWESARETKMQRKSQQTEDRKLIGIGKWQKDLDERAKELTNGRYTDADKLVDDVVEGRYEKKTFNLKTDTYFGGMDLGEWDGKDFNEAKENFLKENPSYANGKYGRITGSEKRYAKDVKSMTMDQYIEKNNAKYETNTEDYSKHAGWELYSDDPRRYESTLGMTMEEYNEKMANWQGPGAEPYKYKNAYKSYHNKLDSLRSRDKWTGKEYTNDEFMEHLTDSNWHTERRMLEDAGLTNDQLSYIKDQVVLGEFTVGLDKKSTERLIKEAKSGINNDISPMSEYSGRTREGHSYLQEKELNNIKIKEAPASVKGRKERFSKLKPIQDHERDIQLGINKNDYTAYQDEQILDGVVGQMSDGIWENSPRASNYWSNMDFGYDEKGNIVMRTEKSHWTGNPFATKTDEQIKNYIAEKAKQIVKIENEDNGDLKWDRNNDNMSHYLTYDKPVTVAEVYSFYDRMKGRKGKSYKTTGQETFTKDEVDTIKAKVDRYKKRKGTKGMFKVDGSKNKDDWGYDRNTWEKWY